MNYMGRVHHKANAGKAWPTENSEYLNFDTLDGSHSWQSAVPDGCVLYSVRKLNSGKVAYFNFALAKEMGLISKDHPEHINKKLEKKLLDTFSIRIINEYDRAQNIIYHPSVVKKNKYMATRYLQLQHKSKLGKTSGDGRCIWNGELRHNGTTWDVSSRGTGVTCLSPGAVKAKRPLQSGNTSFGYGCGMADLDELISAAIQAEIFHRNGILTERVLCVIDLGEGNAIGVRAGKNLFRPAHLFMYLKQKRYRELQLATDYLIERQFRNKDWKFQSKQKSKYDLMLKELTESFGQFVAQLDREYIFAWLDWDGDNVLFNAGIIDYGSIRQFGLRHDEYRYDDVDRFSTNLKEQVNKAAEIVQVFSQLVNYLKTKKRRSLKKFANSVAVKQFKKHYQYYLLDQFLHQIGIERTKREQILKSKRNLIESLFNVYSKIESKKTIKKVRKVSDGINRPPIFNMRSLLYELPSYVLRENSTNQLSVPSPEILFEMALANSARGKDRRLSSSVKREFLKFAHLYKCFMQAVLSPDKIENELNQIYNRAFDANRPDRITGDGLLYIVDEIIKFSEEGGQQRSMQEAIDQLIEDQSPLGGKSSNPENRLHLSRRVRPLFNTLLSLVDGNKESI